MPEAPPWSLEVGDAADVLRGLPPRSFDALVTDPPAGIAFMSASWDRDKGGRAAWVGWLADILGEARSALKPGAYGFVWALPRTAHWTGEALEKAGFEVRDLFHDALPGSTLEDQFLGSLSPEQAAALARVLESAFPSKLRHVFGSGFPKSRALLKPAVEEWFLVRNPGAPVSPLRIDDCRVSYQGEADLAGARTRFTNNDWKQTHEGWQRPHKLESDPKASRDKTLAAGRWPAHLALEHGAACLEKGGKWECAGECPARVLGEQSGTSRSTGGRIGNKDGGAVYSNGRRGLKGTYSAGDPGLGDEGTAARFFHQLGFEPFLYHAKAPRAEKQAGGAQNRHPTVKSVGLMRHLCRLICPVGGAVLDPFAGSGSTGVACAAEGMRFLGIEKEEAYARVAEARLAHAFGETQPRRQLDLL